MTKLRFRADLHIEIVAPDNVFLLSEYSYHTLSGRLYVLLTPLLNGAYGVEEIVRNLAGKASAGEIQYALQRLRRAGYVLEVPDLVTAVSPLDAYFELQGTANGRFPGRRAAIQAFGLPNAREMIIALGAYLEGVGIHIMDEHPDLHIVLVRDYLDPALALFNQTALPTNAPWMLVKPVGAALWIGPIFRPGETACWECLARRLRHNRRVEAFIEQRLALPAPIALSRAALPSTIQTALSIAATEAIHWLNTGQSQLLNSLVVLDTLSLQLRYHTVVKRPQCPVCGDVDIMQAHPIELTSRTKVPDVDGGYRSTSAQATLERYEHLVSPITGAVTVLEPRTSTDLIHVYVAGDNTSRPFQQWEHMRRSLRSLNAGKGMEERQAKVGALCEALERFSGQFDGDEPRRDATYQAIKAEAVHPADLLGFSEIQYHNRVNWNQNHPPNMFVPQRFDEARPIDWSPTWSLTHQREVFIPTAYCYYGYKLPDDHLFTLSDSNGNAAGSSLEDAILQGFMELVERDAIAIWWYNRIQRPAVMLEHPYFQKMCTYYAGLHRDLWILDLTTDLGIPACAAISRRVDKPAEDILMGFGAHFDLQVAALRALTEINQMLFPVLDIAADSTTGAYGSESRWEIEWWQTATIATEPYLVPEPSITPSAASKYPHTASTDLRDDVLACVEIARQHGMEVLVLDQTRPDIGLPVVKVVVPGMCHFWGRFAQSRLYDVPLQMGWRSEPTPEAILNTRPMMI